MGQSKRKTYTVSDMASIVGVTVASISKYVKRNQLKPIATGKNNAKYFDNTVLEEIKSYYHSKSEKRENSEYRPATKDDIIQELRNQIAELESTNNLLRDELAVKNRQIENAIRLADQAQKLDLTTHNQKLLPNENESVKPSEKEEEKHGILWRLTH